MATSLISIHLSSLSLPTDHTIKDNSILLFILPIYHANEQTASNYKTMSNIEGLVLFYMTS